MTSVTSSMATTFVDSRRELQRAMQPLIDSRREMQRAIQPLIDSRRELQRAMQPLIDSRREMQRAMQPLIDSRREMQRAIQPLIDSRRELQRAMQPLIDSRREMQRAIQPLIDSRREMQKAIQPVADRWVAVPITPAVVSGLTKSFRRSLDRIERDDRSAKALEKAGLLPHHSTPFEIVEHEIEDTATLRQSLFAYYRENWSAVRHDIEVRLDDYGIDEEAKATFREALDAHEGGQYRCVCRVLWPEIERVVRVELHANKIKNITSQHHLKEKAGNLSVVSIAPGGLHCLNLFRRLKEHLYASITNEADRERFADDPVPNRHAAMHGLVSYSSVQNSLNTIFMTEYILQVVSNVRSDAY